MKTKARARTPRPRTWTKAEEEYAYRLEALRQAGEIQRFRYEPLKLSLGKACWYTPDFLVVAKDGTLELHEVKAMWRGGRVGWREDAKVKWRVAARTYPEFRFVLAVYDRGEFKVEEVE